VHPGSRKGEERRNVSFALVDPIAFGMGWVGSVTATEAPTGSCGPARVHAEGRIDVLQWYSLVGTRVGTEGGYSPRRLVLAWYGGDSPHLVGLVHAVPEQARLVKTVKGRGALSVGVTGETVGSAPERSGCTGSRTTGSLSGGSARHLAQAAQCSVYLGQVGRSTCESNLP